MFATSTAPESLICFDCGKFYKAEEEFSAHLASCDVNVDGDDDDEEEENEDEMSDSDEGDEDKRKQGSKKDNISDVCEFCSKSGSFIRDCPIELSNVLSVMDKNKEKECILCGLKKNKLSKIKKHVIIHFKSHTHNCQECGLSFKNQQQFSNHFPIVHDRESHIAKFHSDSGKTFPCPDCDYVGRRADTTNKHIKRIHKEVSKKQRKIYKCQDCEFNTTVSEITLRKHGFSEHGKTLCSKCNNVFEDLETFTKHFHTTKVACHDCGILILEKGLERHIEVMHGETSTILESCTECGKKLKARSMGSHIKKVHTNKFLFPCPHCTKYFPTKQDLQRHISRVHEAAQVVNCPWCGRVTKDLERHLHNNQCNVPEHEKTKLPRISCHSCSKTFVKNVSLKRHIEIVHEKKKTFRCSYCAYKSSTGFNLRIHVKRVHERRPLKEICPFCYQPCIALEWHIKTYHAEVATDLLRTSIDEATVNNIINVMDVEEII